MKDIIISIKRQKKELLIFGICFILSFAINIIAIIIYDTEWEELFTYIGYVLTISIVLYLLLAVVRLFVYFIKKLLLRK